MSASNWTICPDCVKRIKDLKIAFEKKYYGEIDSYLYGKIIAEIDKAITHVKSYSNAKFKPDAEIMGEMDKKDIKVNVYGNDYDCYEILAKGQISCSLREDYEQGINSDGNVYFIYECSCNCGFNKNINYSELKHKIIDKQ